jgi:hypothetical protein
MSLYYARFSNHAISKCTCQCSPPFFLKQREVQSRSLFLFTREHCYKRMFPFFYVRYNVLEILALDRGKGMEWRGERKGESRALLEERVSLISNLRSDRGHHRQSDDLPRYPPEGEDSIHFKNLRYSGTSALIPLWRYLRCGCNSRSFRKDTDSTRIPQRFKAHEKCGYDLTTMTAPKPVIRE